MSSASLPTTFDPKLLAGAKVVGALHRDAATILIAESVLEEMIEFSEEDRQWHPTPLTSFHREGGESLDATGVLRCNPLASGLHA